MRHTFFCVLLGVAASLPAFSAVDEGLLAYVPTNTKLISSVDINQAKNSQFGQYLLNKINIEDESFRDMVDQTGFDPRRDLQDFVFASPGPSSSPSSSKFVLLVRGAFDQPRIRAAALAKGSSIKNVSGFDLLISRGENAGHAFTFLASGIAVMGDIASVEQLVASGPSHPSLDPKLQSLVASVGPNNDAWFISLMPGSYLADHVKQETNQQSAAQALNSIVESSGGIQFGDIVRLSFDAMARSPKDAQSLVDVIRFLGSMVQMSREKAPGAAVIASAVDQMTLQTDGDAVHIALSLPEKSLEQLADMGPAAHARHHQMK